MDDLRPNPSSLFGTAVILAGGQSCRMGFDKQDLQIKRENIMRKTIRELSQTFPDIVVVTNTPERYAGMPVRLAKDRYRNCGPLAGLEVGLAESRSQYVFLRACDMPVYDDRYVRYMMEQLRINPVAVCTTEIHGNIEPFNSFYHQSLLADAQHQLKTGRKSFRALMDRHPMICISEDTVRRFDPDLSQFINLNTPEEYQAYVQQEKK